MQASLVSVCLLKRRSQYVMPLALIDPKRRGQDIDGSPEFLVSDSVALYDAYRKGLTPENKEGSLPSQYEGTDRCPGRTEHWKLRGLNPKCLVRWREILRSRNFEMVRVDAREYLERFTAISTISRRPYAIVRSTAAAPSCCPIVPRIDANVR
jgi:hypothetical protein